MARLGRVRLSPRQYVVREQLIDRVEGILAPVYYGPGTRRDCERRLEQLNHKPLPGRITSRDVTVHRLFPLYG